MRFIKTRFATTREDGKRVEYPVWRTERSSGSPVLLLHALNGISPRTLDLALEMESWGHRVYIPSLYGDEILGEKAYGYDRALRATRYLDFSDDWRVYQVDGPGPILKDVRAMSQWVSQKEGGRDITVIGNCLTGIFPFALIDEPHVKRGVIAQPASPLKHWYHAYFQIPQLPWHNPALGLKRKQIESSLAALESNPEKQIFGFHYFQDPLASFSKFENLNRKLAGRGLDGQFKTILLAAPEDVPILRREHWSLVGETCSPTTKTYPHSTIINPATDEDRFWFREKLRLALAGKL